MGKFDDEIFDDDYDGSSSSRYRLKKRNRRKRTLFFLLTFICLLGGSYLTYHLINDDNKVASGTDSELSNDEPTNVTEEIVNKESTSTDKDEINDNIESIVEEPSVEEEQTDSHNQVASKNEDSDDFIEDGDTSLFEEKEIAHEIKAGDSLYKLSTKYYQSSKYQQFLAEYNKVKNSDNLQIGQIIKIPFPPPSEWHAEEDDYPASAPTQSIHDAGKIHEVEKGDTLYSISLKYYNSPHYQDLIIEHNSLENPSALDVGDQLLIPSIDVESAFSFRKEISP